MMNDVPLSKAPISTAAPLMRRAPRWSMVSSRGNQRVVARVDGRAAGEQGHGLGRPAVVREHPEIGVDAHDVAVDAVEEAAGAGRVADQVVAAGDRTVRLAPRGVIGHDGVVQGDVAADALDAAAAASAALPATVQSVSVSVPEL